jgi:hypothetical protein
LSLRNVMRVAGGKRFWQRASVLQSRLPPPEFPSPPGGAQDLFPREVHPHPTLWIRDTREASETSWTVLPCEPDGVT